MKKNKPLTGIFLIALGFLIADGERAGVAGHLLTASLRYLVGRDGIGIVIITLPIVGLFLLGPQSMTKLVRDIVHVILRIVSTIISHMISAIKRRSQRRAQTPIKPSRGGGIIYAKTEAVPENKTIREVRSVLIKDLEFNQKDVDLLVPKMDPALGHETLLRQAITTLSQALAAHDFNQPARRN
jgi:hypothetical protein